MSDSQSVIDTGPIFTSGLAEEIVQVVGALVPGTAPADDACVVERAIALLAAIAFPMVDLRDAGRLDIGPEVIAQSLDFYTLATYATDTQLPITKRSREIVWSYINSLPGLQVNALVRAARGDALDKFEVPGEAARQFERARRYLTQAMAPFTEPGRRAQWH